MMIEIAKIRLDGGTQLRAAMNQEAVQDFAAVYETSESPPDVVLFFDGQHYWPGDGHHRIAGARLAKAEDINAEVREGTLRDAILYAAGCNAAHDKSGLKRTNADKRKAIEALLADEEWAKASTNWIAEMCKVSDNLVSRLRKQDSGQSGEEEKSTSTNGSSNNQGEETSEKRTGKDGKDRPATQTKPQKILCKRCAKEAPGKGVKGCPACKDLNRKPGKPAPKEETAETNGEAPAIVDAFGNPVPKKLQNAYLDPWIQSTIDYLAPVVAAFWLQRFSQGMRKRKGHYPFFNAKDFDDGCAMAGNTIEQLIDHLKEFRPAAVCPMCGGKKCADCLMSGLVPRKLYAELKKKAKKETVK